MANRLPSEKRDFDSAVPPDREIVPHLLKVTGLMLGSHPLLSIEPHPELAIETEITGHASIDKATVARGGQFCATPHEVLIGLGPTKRLVRLPQAASRGACVQEALARHAQRHVAVEDKAMSDYVAGTELKSGPRWGSSNELRHQYRRCSYGIQTGRAEARR